MSNAARRRFFGALFSQACRDPRRPALRRAGFHAGRTGVAVIAKIAFVGFGFSARTLSPMPLLRTTGRTTTSIAPYGQATTQVLQPMQRSCMTCTKPFSRLIAPFGQTFAHGASSHWRQMAAVEIFTPLMTWMRGRKCHERGAVLLRLMGNHARYFTVRQPIHLLHRP